MENLDRILEIATTLEVGSEKSITVLNRMKAIAIELKIQASGISLENEAKETAYIAKVLTKIIDDLQVEVKETGEKSKYINLATEEVINDKVENIDNYIEEINGISKKLWNKSVESFDILEDLKIICLNLKLQMNKIKKQSANLKKEQSEKLLKVIGAIAIVGKLLTVEIDRLQMLTKDVRDGSKEIGQTINKGHSKTKL